MRTAPVRPAAWLVLALAAALAWPASAGAQMPVPWPGIEAAVAPARNGPDAEPMPSSPDPELLPSDPDPELLPGIVVAALRLPPPKPIAPGEGEENRAEQPIPGTRVGPRALASPGRPAPLLPLYASFAALQALDVLTTVRALDRGAGETNPVIGGIAGNRPALFAAKAGVTVGTVYLAERLWKKNRAAAVVLMAALNGAYAAIVAHNHSVAR